MNRFFKFLMSVVAVAGTLACTTDVTEDFSVKVGGKTQLTLSFDDTRTQLGVKEEGETSYPLTWSENDQVSVNGVTSDKLTAAEGAGTANAVFTFNSELTTPYRIAFPAAAEGQVQFAAVQNHTSDTTFDSKAAAMYGYSANGGNVKLKHLTGILKFSITATDEMVDMNEMTKLSQVRISTIDRKPIAGAFGIDFTTGELTPTNESTNTIVYNMDNYRLAPSASVDVHIAVPAGTYDELYVTIEDSNGNVNYATVKADTKAPLAAGNVREFATPIVFEPINTEEFFVIKDYESLVAFGAYAATGTADTPTTKDAVFVADIQVPADKTWSSISGQYYTGTIYGNGHTIDGLTRRFFITCGATIKGLHLTNVNYSSTNGATANVAALTGIYYGPCITHCSCSGTVILKDFNGDYAVRMGGMIGLIQSKTDIELSHLVNRVNLVTNGTTKSGGGSWPSMGGIFGTVSGATGKLTLKNCVNCGTITVTGNGYFPSRTAGIAGYMAAFKEVEMDNCVNKGAITFSVATLQNSSRNTYVGGLVGDISTNSNTYTIKNCRNEAAVTVNSSNMNRNLFMGGLIGYVKCGTATGIVVENCENSGNVTADIDACKPTNGDAFTNYVSAIIGNLESTVATKVTLKDISNSGKLTYAGCNVLSNSASSTETPCEANTDTHVYVGGFIGKITETSGVTPTYTFTNWSNTGEIEIAVGKAGLNGEVSHFGGFIGNMGSVSVSNAEFRASMTVSKLNEDETYSTYANSGILTGDASGTFTGTVSGTFVCGDGTATLSTTELTTDNYTKYLFSDRTLASYAGVTLAK